MRPLIGSLILIALFLANIVYAKSNVERAEERSSRGETGQSASKTQSSPNRIVGTRDDDLLPGTVQDDLIIGRRGDDQLQGFDGEDLLRGGRGDDDLDGGQGEDILRGNRGDDLLRTEGGGDLLIGGRGEDTFFIAAGSQGAVQIRDFDPEEDRLLIAADDLHALSNESLSNTRRGAKLVLTTNEGEVEIFFRGIRKHALSEAVIEFVSQSPGYGNLRLVSLYDEPLAHEGPVFLEESETLVFTSNRLFDASGDQFVVISSFDPDSGETTDLGLRDAIPMANGATLASNGNIVFDRQGYLDSTAGLSSYDPETGEVIDLVSGVDGVEFNSPNDVVQSSQGEFLFTDPQYGFEQGFRPPPALGNWVWLYDPATGAFTLLADELSRPNGIALSNDEQSVYVTDSGYAIGDGTIDPDGPRNVYEYQLNRENGEVFLSDRRLLATAENGIPDGVKVDEAGNVWFTTGAGLHTLDQTDVQIGLARVPGGTSNFTFTEDGIYVMGETALYMLPIDEIEED